jgi:hypothetical protein
MVPSMGGLSAWVQPIEFHKPSKAKIETLKNSADQTMKKPTIQGDAAKDIDRNHPFVEVTTTLCFNLKAAHFLILQPWFRYPEAWLKTVCIKGVAQQG